MPFLLLSGSFHRNSRSLAILRAVAECLPEHRCSTPRLDALPFYDDDLNGDKPAEVQAFLDAVRASDGLIICTPEYNHSLPAVLKNALDWASRPAFQSPLKDKPVCLVTQAVSAVGGARAQAHLKLVLDSTLSRIQPVHEMLIPAVDRALDENGALIDATVQRRLQRHVQDFVAFAQATRS